ncbi:SPFH domain-containing protein [Catellatospora sp. NPDC049609]|uniref:SPFH domain-containing protein n=1 Tax=Catellatospora sp. NPDC049609 TaxID=3155505 RepID=UPI0034427609
MDIYATTALIALAPLALHTVLRHVPEGQVWILERRGRYVRSLAAGWHLTVPLLDRVKAAVDLAGQMLLWPPVAAYDTPAPTGDLFPAGDGRTVEVRLRVLWRVTDPVRAAYQPNGPAQAIDDLAESTLRRLIADLPSDTALASRGELDRALSTALTDGAGLWAEVSNVRISEVLPHPRLAHH